MAQHRQAAARPRRALRRPSIFGPAPILPGEDPAAYEQLRRQVASSLKPADIIEEIWVHDVVYLEWEILRLRRDKQNLIAAVRATAIERNLNGLIDATEIHALLRGWRAGKPSAIRRIDKILTAANRNLAAALAYALSNEFDRIERLDRLIALAEARRNAALRELDLHRASAAQQLRAELRQLGTLLLENIESGPIAPEPARIVHHDEPR